MPTPYGSRGGMAFGAEELRVLRRALALALHPSPAPAQDVQDCLRLAEAVDEAAREGARLRAFLLADLARYRAALPGTAAGFLTLLEEALGAGYHPVPDDLSALRALRGNPVAAALLDRCHALAEREVRTRLALRAVPASRTHPRPLLTALPGGLGTAAATATAPTAPAAGASTVTAPTATATTPAASTAVTAVTAVTDARAAVSRATAQDTGAGGSPTEEPAGKPAGKPAGRPAREPAHEPAREPAGRPAPQSPPPRERPVPTPGEVFPPKRRPAGPPASPARQLAAV